MASRHRPCFLASLLPCSTATATATAVAATFVSCFLLVFLLVVAPASAWYGVDARETGGPGEGVADFVTRSWVALGPPRASLGAAQQQRRHALAGSCAVYLCWPCMHSSPIPIFHTLPSITFCDRPHIHPVPACLPACLPLIVVITSAPTHAQTRANPV